MAELQVYKGKEVAKQTIAAPKLNDNFLDNQQQVHNKYVNVVSKAKEVTLDLSQFLDEEPASESQPITIQENIESLDEF